MSMFGLGVRLGRGGLNFLFYLGILLVMYE
jgi:hypothetical protein